jgi:hypothetical protein
LFFVYIYIHSFVFLLLPLEHRPSLKRFVSLQLLNFSTVSRTPWTGDQPVARPLPAQDNTNKNKSRQTSMPRVGFEPTTRVRADEDSSCLRPRGHCDRQYIYREYKKKWSESKMEVTLIKIHGLSSAPYWIESRSPFRSITAQPPTHRQLPHI